MSGGRLIIEPYPSGGIVPTAQTLDALQNGVLDVLHVWPGYGAAKEPGLAPISDLVFAYRSPIELDTWLWKKGGMEILRKMYAPFKGYPVGAMYWGVESWPSRKPLAKADDFKGLKIRLPQGLQAEILSKFGASIMQITPEEIFNALDKGMVDACDWSTVGVNDSLGLHDLNGVNYTNYPGFHSMPIGDFTVNIDKWNALTPDLKAIVETACHAWMVDSWQTIYAADIAFYNKHRNDPKSKVTITDFPEAERQKLTDVASEVWDSWKSKSPLAKEAIESQQEWLREIGRIK
jgi:TRAP-type mannitol/chloroaromatic compound transport system substrate-binding protein